MYEWYTKENIHRQRRNIQYGKTNKSYTKLMSFTQHVINFIEEVGKHSYSVRGQNYNSVTMSQNWKWREKMYSHLVYLGTVAASLRYVNNRLTDRSCRWFRLVFTTFDPMIFVFVCVCVCSEHYHGCERVRFHGRFFSDVNFLFCFLLLFALSVRTGLNADTITDRH